MPSNQQSEAIEPAKATSWLNNWALHRAKIRGCDKIIRQGRLIDRYRIKNKK